MSPIDFAQVYSGTADMSLRSLLEKCLKKKEYFFIIGFMETLDRFDIAILNELQNDGRLSNAELATRVGLSAAPCWRRVKALEDSGFITGYRAEINRHKMGLGVLAFVRLDADRNSGDVLQALEEAIRTIPEVISCHYISGTGTFELQVVSRDLNTFSQFAREVLINLPSVKDLHTSFSLGEVKSSSALPLGHLAPTPSTTATPRSRA
jgi:DNA-binding Lrp family transcriptional regulator